MYEVKLGTTVFPRDLRVSVVEVPRDAVDGFVDVPPGRVARRRVVGLVVTKSDGHGGLQRSRPLRLGRLRQGTVEKPWNGSDLQFIKEIMTHLAARTTCL